MIKIINISQGLTNYESKIDHNFELILKNFRIILAHTDCNLKYTWIFNPIPDMDTPSNKHLGLRDDEIDSSNGSIQLTELKRKVLESGKCQMKEIWLPGGEEMHIFKVQAEPLRNNQKEIIGVMTAGLDITEYKKVQADLIHNYKLSAVGELAAGLIHEFKNILAIIMGNIQVLIMKKQKLNLENEVMSKLQVVKEQSIKANGMLSSILTISRSQRPSRQKLNILKIIDNIIELQKIHLGSESIEVIRDYADIPEVYIDPNQLEEVFLNIIINARHALRDSGKGIISVKVKQEGNFIEIKLRDNGSGMDQQTQKNIFKEFFTTKSSNNNDGIEGTGLGLSLTKRIIGSHNGTISVESSKGKGTLFIIKLPI